VKRVLGKNRRQNLRVLFWRSPLRTSLAFVSCVWFSIAAGVWYFEHTEPNHNIETFGDAIWWGIVTLLTVGYGDKYPLTPEGRFLAGILMMSGVVGIAVVTAKISSYFLERAMRERRGLVDTDSLEGHFVICGWKGEMADFLIHFLDSNPNLRADKVVLLTTAPESEIDKIHEIDRLKSLKVIHGEHYLEVNLRRAAPERAIKILILADSSPGLDGHIPTVTEADARTIMTAMSLSNFARGVPVAAELIDSAMGQYLRLAQVNEIIYSRDHSRNLVALASGGVGVINVFHDLLDPKSSSFVSTRALPTDWVGEKFTDLQNRMRLSSGRATLIGILENSGNSFVAKETALRRAEQTPNVRELVQNLQQVKAMKFNNPLINPDPDYVVREGSMLIVIEERDRLHDKAN